MFVFVFGRLRQFRHQKTRIQLKTFRLSIVTYPYHCATKPSLKILSLHLCFMFKFNIKKGMKRKLTGEFVSKIHTYSKYWLFSHLALFFFNAVFCNEVTFSISLFQQLQNVDIAFSLLFRKGLFKLLTKNWPLGIANRYM